MTSGSYPSHHGGQCTHDGSHPGVGDVCSFHGSIHESVDEYVREAECSSQCIGPAEKGQDTHGAGHTSKCHGLLWSEGNDLRSHENPFVKEVIEILLTMSDLRDQSFHQRSVHRSRHLRVVRDLENLMMTNN